MANHTFGLDPEQISAVDSRSSRILVVAPPGSGKTSVLTRRFARLIKDGAEPASILAITFTNRAAREMRERIQALTGLDASALNIGTFHSFALRLIKKTDPAFRLIGRQETVKILKDLVSKDASDVANRISKIKNISSDGENDDVVYNAYRQRLKDENSFDLDDLIPEAIRLLRENPSLARFSDVLIDEFQDINPVQASLIRLLSAGASVLAIGDPDQAIYSFRGSNMESFIHFEKEYPGTEVIRLKKNYRCRASIVDASVSVIKNNVNRMENSTESVRSGGAIKEVECVDEKAEARFIVSEIERLMGGLDSRTVKSSEDSCFSDFAVLYRTNRQAEALQEAFASSSVPFAVMGSAIQKLDDLLMQLKSAEWPEGLTLDDLITREAKACGLEDGALGILREHALRYSGMDEKQALKSLLEELLLSDPVDEYDIKADKVSLMTLHSAKGLEFPIVFIAGAEDGVMPFSASDTDVDEERRLFYVGMTRAKERVYLTRALTRRIFGRTSEQKRSRFTSEIDENLLVTERKEKKKAARRPVQKGLFD